MSTTLVREYIISAEGGGGEFFIYFHFYDVWLTSLDYRCTCLWLISVDSNTTSFDQYKMVEGSRYFFYLKKKAINSYK